MKTDADALVDAALLARLGRIRLGTRRRFRGEQAGERRSRRQGAGLEFAGHRAYAHGDDLRHLDWSLLGRLDRPFLKVYEQETELTVHLLVDATRSMQFGEPTKFLAARRLAAALAYVALGSLDRVAAGFFGGGRLRAHGPTRGRGGFARLVEFLAAGTADARGGLRGGLDLHAAATRPGMTFVFSDFLDPGYRALAAAHRARRHALVLVQVLAREELEPPQEGDLKLTDAETGDEVELTVGRRERAAYLGRLAALQSDLRDLGRRYRMLVIEVPADLALERAMFDRVLPALAGAAAG